MRDLINRYAILKDNGDDETWVVNKDVSIENIAVFFHASNNGSDSSSDMKKIKEFINAEIASMKARCSFREIIAINEQEKSEKKQVAANILFQHL